LVAASRHARIVGRPRTRRHALVVPMSRRFINQEVAGHDLRAADLGNQGERA
jgi:hypothetical protein